MSLTNLRRNVLQCSLPNDKVSCEKIPANLTSIKKEMLKNYGQSKSLESEYIRGLHRQIYLFQLENDILRHSLTERKLELRKLQNGGNENAIKVVPSMTIESEGGIGAAGDLLHKYNELQEKLSREIALRQENMDTFTQKLLKIKQEMNFSERASVEKDAKIEQLNKNLDDIREKLIDAKERYEACKRALANEIQRRKVLEHKIQGQNLILRRWETKIKTRKDQNHSPFPAHEHTQQNVANNMQPHLLISELYKLVRKQTEEMQTLKSIISRKISSPFQMRHQEGKKVAERVEPRHEQQNSENVNYAVRNQCMNVNTSKDFDGRSVFEEPILPTTKKKAA